MTAVAIVAVAAIVVMLALHYYLQRRLALWFTARQEKQDQAEEDRRVALYKQQKATAKTVAQSDRAVRKLADETRHLHDETRLAQQRTDALARDVKEKL